MRRTLREPAAALPVLLWLLALVGMLWANVPWGERLAGFEGFHKLLVIPLLLAQFRRSERGIYVVYGFFVSCTAMLLASWGLMALWKLWWIYVPGKIPGLLVKDYIAQSTEFLICAVALLGVRGRALACEREARGGRRAARRSLFLGNIFYIAPGRTALRGAAAAAASSSASAISAGRACCGACLAAARARRRRMGGVAAAARADDREHRRSARLSGRQRRLVVRHPARNLEEVVRHHRGRAAHRPRHRLDPGAVPPRRGGRGRVRRSQSVNPHNQIFAVGIQLGMLGIAILMTMWIAHLALFRGGGLIAWFGIVVVVQNLASAPVNSHLFDSFHGWLYVFGFGVLGGMALRERAGARRHDDRAARKAAHPRRRVAAARRRAAHDAADPQPEARVS